MEYLIKNSGHLGHWAAVGQKQGQWYSSKCVTLTSLEKERSWFVVFADACERNTPKMADLKLQSDVNWLTKLLKSWHLVLISWLSQIQHIICRVGAEMCFFCFCFCFVLHGGILHYKWKCFKSEIQSNGPGSWGHLYIESPGLCVEFLVFDFTHELLQIVMFWACIGGCKTIVSFGDHVKGSKDWPGWHPKLCVPVASNSIYYVLSL